MALDLEHKLSMLTVSIGIMETFVFFQTSLRLMASFGA